MTTTSKYKHSRLKGAPGRWVQVDVYEDGTEIERSYNPQKELNQVMGDMLDKVLQESKKMKEGDEIGI